MPPQPPLVASARAGEPGAPRRRGAAAGAPSPPPASWTGAAAARRAARRPARASPPSARPPDARSGSFRHPRDMSTDDVPVEMEDRLPRPRADVDEHAVVAKARVAGGLRDEVEHPLPLVGRELAHFAEAPGIALG